MKKIKVLSLLLAMVVSATSLAGCGKKEEATTSQTQGQTEVQKGDTEKKDKKDKKEKQEVSYSGLPEKRTAEKVGTLNGNSINPNSKAGVIYREDQMYRLATLDGNKVSKDKYTVCEPCGDYFKVTTVDPSTIEDAKDYNCMGMVDAEGNEVIPMEYASVKSINERYYQVIKVTGITENKDEALMYATDDMFSISAKDDDTFLKGEWYIYDAEAGSELKGVSGKEGYHIFGYGNIVKYNEGGEQYIINNEGKEIPREATILENGYYTVKEDKSVYLYDSDKNMVKEYEVAGFIPIMVSGDYFIARKSFDEIKYVIMDKDFKTVSAEFKDSPMIFGDLVLAGGKLYDFEGNEVYEGELKRADCDKQYNGAYLLKNDSDYIMIKKDGTEMMKQAIGDDIFADSHTFNISKKVDGKNMYYSLKDKDFTIEGYSIAPWLVRANGEDNKHNLVDTITGETLIKGYSSYSSIAKPGAEIYIYATTQDGKIDVYCVK